MEDFIMTNHSHNLYYQRGFLVLEPLFFLLFFWLVLVLANNGIVNVIYHEWLNAANSASLAGVGKLIEESGNANANQKVIDEAVAFGALHTYLGRPIQPNQITVTLGLWSNCIFMAGGTPSNAVRVDIARPVNEEGNPTGITAFFGRLQGPMLDVLPDQTTAVAAVVESSALLVEYQGVSCSQ